MSLRLFGAVVRDGWLAVGVLLLLAGCGQASGDGEQQEMPPVPVTLETVEYETVTLVADHVGQVRGFQEVDVRAQVGGLLEERLYVEGESVERGQPLFRIDQAPYRIALRQAEAELADARASYNQAERDWDRVESLFARGTVSERDRDQAMSQRELTAARVELAEARVAGARLDLDYSLVTAPLDGVAGLERLQVGSLVEPGTLLTTITQQDPVHIRFALPQRQAGAFLDARAEGNGISGEVSLRLADNRDYDHTGEVDYVGSSVDPDTGNVTVRAVFPNPDHQLMPGQMLRVALPLVHLEQAVTIAPGAVIDARQGSQVYVVDDGDTAHLTPVQLGPRVEGRQVVLEGLEVGDRVVVNGHVALRDGQKVSVEAAAEDEH